VLCFVCTNNTAEEFGEEVRFQKFCFVYTSLFAKIVAITTYNTIMHAKTQYKREKSEQLD